MINKSTSLGALLVNLYMLECWLINKLHPVLTMMLNILEVKKTAWILFTKGHRLGQSRKTGNC